MNRRQPIMAATSIAASLAFMVPIAIMAATARSMRP